MLAEANAQKMREGGLLRKNWGGGQSVTKKRQTQWLSTSVSSIFLAISVAMRVVWPGGGMWDTAREEQSHSEWDRQKKNLHEHHRIKEVSGARKC